MLSQTMLEAYCVTSCRISTISSLTLLNCKVKLCRFQQRLSDLQQGAGREEEMVCGSIRENSCPFRLAALHVLAEG